ncbi:MAG: class I SAM-dependent methyltransferase [Oscillospiraceae bacterium]|nr:class I SAM-dependent methyltransferase [Oscillospiraceae bacterium]
MGIYIWGTGCGASELLERGMKLEQITAFVDSYPMGESFLGKPVLLPEQVDASRVELMIITARQAQAIADRCAEIGIPESRCLFLKNNAVLLDRNDRCGTAEKLLGADLLRNLVPHQRMVATPAQLSSPLLSDRELTNDYVRLSTLELLCRRLEHVPGAAAELGVYRGFFARCINALLPQRKLYLFDSFEGFAEDAHAAEAFQAAHRNTAVEKVLSIMPHRENVIVKPGFFPGSLDSLEKRFCLVSLDVDFYQTTLDGLRYFWPRLEQGGYLMLHDHGSPSLPGVARAMADFEAELGRPLPAVPLCDVGGTLVICKNF